MKSHFICLFSATFGIFEKKSENRSFFIPNLVGIRIDLESQLNSTVISLVCGYPHENHFNSNALNLHEREYIKRFQLLHFFLLLKISIAMLIIRFFKIEFIKFSKTVPAVRELREMSRNLFKKWRKF